MIQPNQEIVLAASSMHVDELFSDVEDIDEDEKKTEPESEVETETESEENEESSEDQADAEVETETESEDDEVELSTGEVDDLIEEDIVKELADKMAESDGDISENEEAEAEEEPAEPVPDIRSITTLGRILRNDGYKLTVFNIKDTLIRYLELFGERKIARHVVDQDGHTFYEIHAVYMPGAVIFNLLTKVGFKPLHPTDLDEAYPKDMRYEIAMSNENLFINVFGGLQQHAPTEETVIRNLYEWEKKRYGVGVATASVSEQKSSSNVEISKNLVLAAMQSFSLEKRNLAYDFFEQAMNSSGIDEFINTLSGPSSFEKQPSFIEPSDFADQVDTEDDEMSDDERIESLEPQESGELFKYE